METYKSTKKGDQKINVVEKNNKNKNKRNNSQNILNV
jgi:hypothetical protein